MHCPVVMLVEVALRVEHALRFLTRRGGIEIDQRMAVDGSVERREVATEVCDRNWHGTILPRHPGALRP
jgi:hypothetical protein